MCGLSVAAQAEWPHGGALIAGLDDEVTCKWCRRIAASLLLPEVWQRAAVVTDPATVPIGTALVVRAFAEQVDHGSYRRSREARPEWATAIAVGWSIVALKWEVESTQYDGYLSHIISRARVLRVRKTPRGRGLLCFVDDVRVTEEKA